MCQLNFLEFAPFTLQRKIRETQASFVSIHVFCFHFHYAHILVIVWLHSLYNKLDVIVYIFQLGVLKVLSHA